MIQPDKRHLIFAGDKRKVLSYPNRPVSVGVAKVVMFPGVYGPMEPASRFMQGMADRLGIGFYRHNQKDKSSFDAKQNYLKRLKGKVRDFERTGNLEFLYDVANYAFLEFENTLHPHAHINTKVDTRGYTE